MPDLAFERTCLFKPWALRALDDAGIPWEMAVDTGSTRTVEASVSADLAVHAMIEGAVTDRMEPIAHGGALPELPTTQINMYQTHAISMLPLDALAAMVRQAYGAQALQTAAE